MLPESKNPPQHEIAVIKYDLEDFTLKLPKRGEKSPSQSKFDLQLTTLWETKMLQNDLFRYKLQRNSLPFKILLGEFNFVMQLNPDRADKRRKPMEIQSPNQPFNPEEFNFNKVKNEEILLRLSPNWEEMNDKHEAEHHLLINVSPLEYCHVLLTPNRNLNGRQRLTPEGIQLGLELVLLSASENFRVGFNSLCGFASVNHEHWHAYLLEQRLYLEDAPLERVKGNCFRFRNERYPPGFCFIVSPKEITEGGFFLEKNKVFRELVNYFEENGVAHNVYMTRGINPIPESEGEADAAQGKDFLATYDCVRIFVWARTSSFGAKGCDAFNPALCELAGHFPIKNERAYEDLTEENILTELHAICDEPFEKMKKYILDNF